MTLKKEKVVWRNGKEKEKQEIRPRARGTEVHIPEQTVRTDH